MKTLYVHIGSPKTASTALQFFCVDNSDLLNQKGYCYPLFPQTYPDASRIRAYFLVVRLKNRLGRRSRRWEEKVFQEGMAVIHKSFETYDNVIISDERIWRSMDIERKELWKKLAAEGRKGGFQIRVIAYVRRQDKFLISLWNQQIKIIKVELAKCTIEEWMDKVNLRARLEYADKLDRIAKVIGKENVIVRRFDGSFEGGSIYADFLSAVGLSLTDEYEIKQEVVNIGLYGNTQELKRVINFLPQMMKDRNTQNFIMEMLQECSEASKKNYPCEMLSKEEIEALLKEYEAGNRKIAEEYLHDSTGQLFNNTIKDLPKWQKDNPYILDDLIRFANVAMENLYQKYQEAKADLKELEESLKALCKAEEADQSAEEQADIDDKTAAAASEKLPVWNKEDPDGIDELILFVGDAIIRLYQENRELKKTIKKLKTLTEEVDFRSEALKQRGADFDFRCFTADCDTTELKEMIQRIPKPGEEDTDLADRFIRATDLAANGMYQENNRLKRETEEIKSFMGYEEEQPQMQKTLLERILKK